MLQIAKQLAAEYFNVRISLTTGARLQFTFSHRLSLCICKLTRFCSSAHIVFKSAR